MDEKKLVLIKNPPLVEELIIQKEEMWRIQLPQDYRKFLLECNGGIFE